MRTVLFCLMVSIATTDTLRAEDAPVPQWSRWERAFTAEKAADEAVELTVTFTAPGGQTQTVEGFWDGGATWRVRFMPNEQGKWAYRTSSKPATAGLDAQAGEFQCVAAAKSATRFGQHGAVRVADGKTYLAHADGTPFFWLGDTVWSGPSMATREDWNTYLADRRDKSFSVVQFNAICPWRCAATDRDGHAAYSGSNPIRIEPKYFQRIDAYYDAINQHGLLAAPILCWAHKAGDAGMELSETDIIKLVRYQVARYGSHHVLWLLAGDNSYKPEQALRWQRIGRAVFGGRPHAPVTTHPTGMNWPWDTWRDEKWLDVLGYQSGHGDDARTLAWIHSGPVAKAWHNEPARPIINLEPPYEDHFGYQSKQPHSAYNIRRAVYWSLLCAPPAGVTYGGHGVWSWHTEPGKPPVDHPYTGVAKTWREALDLPGAKQMQHVAALFSELDWPALRPAPALLAVQPGDADPARFIACAQSADGATRVVYIPVSGEVRFNLERLSALRAPRWFNPRTGESLKISSGISATGGVTTPDENDWLLVDAPPRPDSAGNR